MRSPIFLRFREDKKPEECVIGEWKRYTKRVIETDRNRTSKREISHNN